MTRLTVLYDAGCPFCVRCRHWLQSQPAFLPLEFVPAASVEARRRFPALDHPDPPEELVVVDDDGGVYRGSDGWILCLYALVGYREWSYRLAGPSLRPLARAAFAWLSSNRQALSRRLGLERAGVAESVFTSQAPAACRTDSAGCETRGGLP